MANTSAPLSETAIATMAAGLLDEYHISDLDDDHPMARFMAREFGYVRDEFLQLYPWHFATTRASLPEVLPAPAFGWLRAFQRPHDCIRMLPLRVGGFKDGPEVPHEVESGRVLTDAVAPLLVRYVKREIDLTKWSPLAARALACRLAMFAATRVTGKTGYYQKAQQAYQEALTLAMHADSLERGPSEYVLSGHGTSVQETVMSVRGV